MSGVWFDYSSERQRHEKFVGRAALLARLDQLLVDSETDRWVVITGGPGMGKSALLAAWLARREAADAVVPHHLIRRGAYDWDDPAKLVGSLVAQLETGFPELREPDGDERMHPATRLARALSRVSEQVLRPRRQSLVVLIDGLDEYDPPVGTSGSDPLAAFLPDALPAGVRLLCASRPRHPYMSSLEGRDGELVQIDLDDPESAADNDATVRMFWEAAAVPLGLDAGFVDEVIARAGGNVQHAVQLRKHLAVLPPEQRRIEDIPRGLAALIEKAWERIAVDAVVVEGLGILCAAREALTLDELGAVVDWTGETQRRAFLRAARELLVESQRPDGQPEYQLHHDAIRAYIARAIGEAALRVHHSTLAQRLATWPAPRDGTGQQYALRHALTHRAEAGEWAIAWQLASNMSFLEAKCHELGAHETEIDIVRLAKRCRASDDVALFRRFSDLGRALGRESHWLRIMPEAMAPLMWNRLRRLGWSVNDLDGQLQIPVKLSFLRMRYVVTLESPALIRDLVGHSAGVTACAVTPDGRRVVSASEDNTLKVWDLETGRALVTLEGHAGWVRACAVTPDSRRAVSGSVDKTLKIWDLESGRMLGTLEGHTSWVTGCAVTADGKRVVSASSDGTLKVWDLESRIVLVTLVVDIHTMKRTVAANGRVILEWDTGMRSEYADVEIERLVVDAGGHSGGSEMACAITPDGRRAVSTSKDKTLKVWDLESGCVITTLQGHTGNVLDCAVTPDGQRVVSASEDGTLNVWDLESGRAIATLGGKLGWVRACAVTSDGQRVVSALWNGLLVVWEFKSGRALTTFIGHAHWLWGCAVTPDGRRAISASNDKTLKIWDLDSAHALASRDGHFSRVTACTLTADGQRLISSSFDHTLKVWDLNSGRALATLVDRTGALTTCAVTPDGRRAISGSSGTMKVWNLENGRTLTILKGHTRRVEACTVTPDGRRLVSASNDYTLRVWDLKRRRTLVTLKGHTAGVEACAVTPDGRRVVSGSQDQTLKIWDIEHGHVLATLKGHATWVTACVVTPDGQRLVSASDDKTLKVWDMKHGDPLATLEGHAEGVSACAVTPDGRHAISASRDRTLRVWDLKTYACLLTHHGDAAYSAVVTSAKSIIAGDEAGALWVLDWPLQTHQSQRHQAGARHDSHHEPPPSYANLSLRPPTKKHIILFLAANPLKTDRTALDREARAIQVELEQSGHRDRFELVTRWAVQPLDLLRELRKLKPTVVHFSGHGSQGKSGKLRPPNVFGRILSEHGALDSKRQHGLFFQGSDGRPQFVSTAALKDTFGAAGSSVKLVVLNACYSEAQAEALLAHVGCVVGMGGAISEEAARNFAIGFYGGLGERESVVAAYQQGRAAISLEGLRDRDRPKLKVLDGVDAGQIVLAEDSS